MGTPDEETLGAWEDTDADLLLADSAEIADSEATEGSVVEADSAAASLVEEAFMAEAGFAVEEAFMVAAGLAVGEAFTVAADPTVEAGTAVDGGN